MWGLISNMMMSNRKAGKIFQSIKKIIGRRQFEKGSIERMISECLNSMKQFFTSEKTAFMNGKEEINSTLTYVKDLNHFIDKVCEGRRLENPKCIIGLDGGKNKILVTLTLHEDDDTTEGMKTNGSCCIMVLASADYASENRHNIEKVLEKIDLKSLKRPWQWISDLKAANLVWGKKDA